MSGVATTFLDANVLVYARDRSERVKGPQAQRLLSDLFRAGQPLVSVQVLAEFFWATTRKLPMPLTHDEALAEVKRLLVLSSVIPVNLEVFEKALAIATAHALPLWDAQIVAAAIVGGATCVLSEDFQDRRSFEVVTVVNPFTADFDLREVVDL